MLMENVISRVDVSKILKKHMNMDGAIWKCPECGRVHTINYIEDFIDTDLRNPSDEYFYCPGCDGKRYSLLRDGVVIEKKDKYKLYSDGTMLYVKDKEGWFWMV